MRNIQILLKEPSVSKWIKWVSVLLLARIPKATLWASFLSLNPLIRKFLFQESIVNQLKKRNMSWPDIKARLFKVSNAITCAFLYFAIVSNAKIPKDYCVVFLWMSYFGELNTPRSSEASEKLLKARQQALEKIEISSASLVSPLFKLDPSLPWLTKLYNNKEYIFFPMIYAQILSNYLTPTKYKLNHKYLSAGAKKYILNPIWINYSLTKSSFSFNIAHLLRNYILHNLALATLFGLMHFKEKLLNEYYRVHFELVDNSISNVVKQYLTFIWSKANALTNFIYLPNLFAMIAISLTSGVLTSNQSKFFLKSYMKLVGFSAAFATLYINGMLPDKTFTKLAGPIEIEEDNPRKLSKPFFNSLNLYLFRLILLTKWRITKGNHPLFKTLSLSSWNILETGSLCLGVYKVMVLNDFIRDHNEYTRVKELEKHNLIKMVNLLG